MNKIIKWSIVIGIFSFFLFASAIFYSFAYRPFKKDYNFNQCLKQTEKTYLQKQQEISSRINELNQQKETESPKADKKLAKFIEENPEPKRCGVSVADDWKSRLNFRIDFDKCGEGIQITNEWKQWDKKAQQSFDFVRSIENELRSLERSHPEEERDETKENCYKQFK